MPFLTLTLTHFLVFDSERLRIVGKGTRDQVHNSLFGCFAPLVPLVCFALPLELGIDCRDVATAVVILPPFTVQKKLASCLDIAEERSVDFGASGFGGTQLPDGAARLTDFLTGCVPVYAEGAVVAFFPSIARHFVVL